MQFGISIAPFYLLIGSLTTDDNGEFYATWNAVQRSGGGSYDFYAVFEGSANIDYSRSQTHSVTVATAPTPTPTPTPTSACDLNTYNSPTLILDPVTEGVSHGFSGRVVTAGDTITFTGRL